MLQDSAKASEPFGKTALKRLRRLARVESRRVGVERPDYGPGSALEGPGFADPGPKGKA